MKCDVAAIWQDHKIHMERFVRKRIMDEDLAKDILQEVVLKMCEFCVHRDDVKNIRNWLYQITRNVIIDHFRKEQKKDVLSAVVVPAEYIEENVDKIVPEFIAPLIGKLPEKYRMPLLWSDIEQVPQVEIAKKLNISFSGAKSRVQRARKQLKELFYECCHLELDHLGNIIDCQPKANCTLLATVETCQNDC